MTRADRAVSSVLVLISAFFFYSTPNFITKPLFQMPGMNRGILAPEVFPRIVFGIMTLCSLVYFISSMRAREMPRFSAESLIALKDPLLGIFPLLVAYGVLMNYAGFWISSVLFLVGCCWYWGARSPLAIGLTSIVSVGIVYWFFEKVLVVLLPAMRLGL